MSKRIIIDNKFEFNIVIDVLQRHDYFWERRHYTYEYLFDWYNDAPFVIRYDNTSGEISDSHIENSNEPIILPIELLKKHLEGETI